MASQESPPGRAARAQRACRWASRSRSRNTHKPTLPRCASLQLLTWELPFVELSNFQASGRERPVVRAACCSRCTADAALRACPCGGCGRRRAACMCRSVAQPPLAAASDSGSLQIMMAVTQQGKRPPLKDHWGAAQVCCPAVAPHCACSAAAACLPCVSSWRSALTLQQACCNRHSVHASCARSLPCPAVPGRHICGVRRVRGPHAALLVRGPRGSAQL